MIAHPFARLISKLTVRASRADRRRAARLGVEQLEPRDVPDGTVAGRFWLDQDGDYQQDADEPGVQGVLVESMVDESVVASGYSDAAGEYAVTGVPDNSYTVRLTLPTGTTLSFGTYAGGQPMMYYPMSSGGYVPLPVYPTPVVSVTRVSDAIEGGAPGYFRFTRDVGTGSGLTATYAVQTIGPGLATPDADYAALPGTVTFPAAVSSVDVPVTAFADGIAEYPESVIVSVTAGTGYLPAEEPAQVWIWDDVSPLKPVVSVAGIVDAVEGVSDGMFRFGRSGPTTASLTASYTILSGPGEATPGDDYTPLSGTVYFPAGVSTVDELVVTAADDVEDGTERVTVQLTAADEYEIADPGIGVVQIMDPDTVSEAGSGPGADSGDEYEPGTISGRVWNDLDSDGLQEVGEPGRVGQTVRLYREGRGLLFTVATGLNGHYAFKGLSAGSYEVQFSSPPLMAFSEWDVGSDDTVDSDANPLTGVTAPIALVAGAMVRAYEDAGLVAEQQPAANEVKIIITGAGGAETSKLKVAKWEKAFGNFPPGDPNAGKNLPAVLAPGKDGLDFIDNEPDRFNVRVYDPVAYNNPNIKYVDVTIETKNQKGFEKYDDNPTIIRLVKLDGIHAANNSGWFMSDSQILVSNTVDDKYTMGSKIGATNRIGVDDAPPEPDPLPPAPGQPAPTPRRIIKNNLAFTVGDRTHTIALDGVTIAKYQGLEATAKTEIEKRVKLHPMIMNIVRGNPAPNTIPSVTTDSVIADVDRMREIYAQIGVAVEFTQPVVVDCPQGPPEVDLSNGLDVVTVAGGTTPAPEWITLYSHTAQGYRTPAVDDVELYYVNDITSKHFGASVIVGNIAAPGRNSVVIREARPYITLAHEVLHLLLGTNNHTGGETPQAVDRTQLLVRTPAWITTGTSILDSRRIREAEQKAMGVMGVNNILLPK